MRARTGPNRRAQGSRTGLPCPVPDAWEVDPSLPDPGSFGTALVAMAVVAIVVVVIVAVAAVAGRHDRGEAGAGSTEAEPLVGRRTRTRQAADRLRELQALRDAGAISEAEYAERRAAIVKDV